MSKLKLNKGEKFSAPAINTILEKEAQAAMDKGEKEIENDWVNSFTEPCTVCHGSGIYQDEDTKKTEPCIGCEATGIDYRFVYGVEGMRIFSYVEQYGLDAFKEFCKARREAELENLEGIKKKSMRGVFALPQVLKFELESRGFDVDALIRAGQVREMAKIISSEYPEFMTTNLRNW